MARLAGLRLGHGFETRPGLFLELGLVLAGEGHEPPSITGAAGEQRTIWSRYEITSSPGP